MNTQQIILLVGFVNVLISGLAILLGFLSLYKLRKDYPNYRIPWAKNILLWLVWSVIFIFSLGILKYQNWARIGLIAGLFCLFVTIIIVTIIRLIGYIMLVLGDSDSSTNYDEEDASYNNEYSNEYKNNKMFENDYNYSFNSYAKQGLIITIILAFLSNLVIFTLISFLRSTEVANLMVN